MAGTLTISTLSDGTNSTSSTNCIQGSAKAWVNYNGVTQVVRASYNVSSVTYVSTGIYRLNFTNALVDSNFSTVTTAGDTAGGATRIATATVQTTTSVTVQSFAYVLTAFSDSSLMGVACFR